MNMFLSAKKLTLVVSLFATLIFSSCVKDSTKGGGASGGTAGAVNRVVGNNFTASTFTWNTATIINLDYTDLDGSLATSCSVDNLTNVSVTNSCSCSGAGICSVGVKAPLGYSGGGSFTFNVVSGGRTSTTGTASFTVIPLPSNSAPTVSSITPVSFNEDIQSIITLPYSDLDSDLATSCSISSLTNVTETQACSCDGSGICTVGVTGSLDHSGAASFQYSVVANSQASNSATATLAISAVNDVPTISTIVPQTTLENVATSAIAFTISDIDSALTCSAVVGSSSNTAIVSNANIVIGGTAPNCTVTVTPSNNAAGTLSITLIVTDTGTPLPAQTASSVFALTVDGTNTPPTISTIANQVTNEDLVMPAKSFTIGDLDSAVACSNVVGTSSNTAVVPNANIVIGGTAPNCTVTITPASNQSGSANITLTLTDIGTPLPAQIATTVFTLTVAPINDVPTISTIANQVTTEGVPTSSISFSIQDLDSTINCSDVIGTSNNTTLVANANIVIGGTAPNCTAILTPTANQNGVAAITLTLTDAGTPLPTLQAVSNFNLTVGATNSPPTISFIANASTDEDTNVFVDFTLDDIDSTPAMTCTSANLAVFSSSNGLLFPGVSGSDVVFSGTYPNCRATFIPVAEQSGSSNIVIRITDNGFPTPVITTDSNVFTITVSPINDNPVISTVLDQVVNKNIVTGSLSFTISDIDSVVSCSNVVGTSSNLSLVPNANIVIGGSAPNCTVTVTPDLNQTGTATITLLLTDIGTPLPAASASSSFLLTVNAFNSPPSIGTVANQIVNEDTSTAALSFVITDIDSSITCADVVGTSSDIIKVPNANIVIGGTAPNCTVTVTPAANQNGLSTITLTLTDLGTPLPAKTALTTFTLTINPINDAPVISSILSQNTDEDISSTEIAFTISDIDSAITCADVVGTSSNVTIVPNANIVIAGTAPNCSVVVTGGNNQNGTVSVTLTLTDLGTPMPALNATSVFTLGITPVPDLSGSLLMSGVASSFPSNTYARKMVFTSLTIDEAASAVDTCLSYDSNANSTLDSVEMCNVQNWLDVTSVIGASGTSNGSTWANFQMKDGANGAVFTAGETPLKKSCSVENKYWLSTKVINSNSRESNIISTTAWTFWEPTCLGTGLAQWLDATETSTITIATGVSSWTDKSANARTITQATTSKQPAYSATALGTGLPGVTFNGTSHILTRTAFAYAQGSASFFAVIKGAAPSATKYIFSEGRTASANNYYSPLLNSSTNKVGGRNVNNAGTSEFNASALSPILFDNTIRLVMTEDTGTSFYAYSNGTAQTQAITNYTRAASTIDLYVLGARWRTAAAASWFAGSIGEFIITNGVLIQADRQKLEAYSAHKWGTSANLPVSNPYKTTPP